MGEIAIFGGFALVVFVVMYILMGRSYNKRRYIQRIAVISKTLISAGIGYLVVDDQVLLSFGGKFKIVDITDLYKAVVVINAANTEMKLTKVHIKDIIFSI